MVCSVHHFSVSELPVTMNSARPSSAQLLLVRIGKLGWCAHLEGSVWHPAAYHLKDVDWPVKVESARLSSAQCQWRCWPGLGSWGGVHTHMGVHGILQPTIWDMWIGHWKCSLPEELQFLQEGVCFSQQHSVPDFGSGDGVHTRRGVPVVLADHRVCVSWRVANLQWSAGMMQHVHCAQEGQLARHCDWSCHLWRRHSTSRSLCAWIRRDDLWHCSIWWSLMPTPFQKLVIQCQNGLLVKRGCDWWPLMATLFQWTVSVSLWMWRDSDWWTPVDFWWDTAVHFWNGTFLVDVSLCA